MLNLSVLLGSASPQFILPSDARLEINLTQINSLVEDKAMLAENRQHWAERERQEGHKEGHKEGRQQANRETA
ncbi:MAG: hypothetical protein K9L88_19300, partial [Chromatiaceae bacterium]|nr:hypothetical protein [Chromatiaceae bacterium]